MGSCAAPSAKGDDKFITTDYLQQCQNDQHHLIPTSWIGEVKEDQVILNKNSEEVKENWQAI
ncbi:replication initiator protein [Acinetobacter baumannii]|nr:DUF2171 domain-containing protein [Acinetobacter baumannii]MCJ9351486.1 DUF2171 domain-containing protein [Acinetobacter baumannii]SSO80716.1 replication initiator protein [Acinetobacter baumannii]SST47177.1 replication initiator protein [Acinetobacter baumannii]SSU14657.1 replication initiator protein [Acinetobacter baumannii]